MSQNFSKITLFLASALILNACSSSVVHPKMLSFTPASVVIDYTGSDLYSATQLGQQFCSSIDKDAQYVRTEKEDSWFSADARVAYFNCVESSRKNQNAGITSTQKDTPIINNFRAG